MIIAFENRPVVFAITEDDFVELVSVRFGVEVNENELFATVLPFELTRVITILILTEI